MDILIKRANLEKIKDKMMFSLREYSSYFDSFLEEHIIKSNHYEILLNSKQIGYFSIFNKDMLTQYYLDEEFRCYSQEVFEKIKRYEEVHKAFVYTGDEFFLTHIIDYSKKIEPQAYFFADAKGKLSKDKLLTDFTCRLALEEDTKLIKEKSWDFFDDLAKQINKKEIYIGYVNEEVVSFGIIEKSQIYPDVASIGMYTVAHKRQGGIGRNTLIKLREICYDKDITPIAGCWYYNHNSKKTLESSGMISKSRLLIAKL